MQVNLYRQFKEFPVIFDCPEYEPIPSSFIIASSTYSRHDLILAINALTSPGYYLIEMSKALPGLQRKARKNELFLWSTILRDNIFLIEPGFGFYLVQINLMKFSIPWGSRVCFQVTPLTQGFVRGEPHQQYLVIT